MIAGATDAIGFLALGLFTAHVTGNLVILAAHVVSGSPASVAKMISIPVFMLVLGLARLLASACAAFGLATLQTLLLLQALFLAGFFGLGIPAEPRPDPNTGVAIAAGMFGVAAMAIQNALVQIALPDSPSTAVMTSNVTRFMMDVCTLLVARDPAELAKARNRAKRTWPAIVGFACGCAIGATCQATIGLWSLALPTGLALLAFMMSFAGERRV